MKFEEFKKNVEEWARVRGIYEQSTEAHQQAKALEEIGEYLTAETDKERMDAIGDIAVCIVNAARLSGQHVFLCDHGSGCIERVASNIIQSNYKYALTYLCGTAMHKYYIFGDCLSQAWNEIKDRKGMMINGLYVKWESMTEEQRAEFNRRDSGNTLIRA